MWDGTGAPLSDRVERLVYGAVEKLGCAAAGTQNMSRVQLAWAVGHPAAGGLDPPSRNHLPHQADVTIETGVAHGGSPIFYASLCKAIGKGRVIGIVLRHQGAPEATGFEEAVEGGNSEYEAQETEGGAVLHPD